MKVTLCDYLPPEQHFNSVKELKDAIWSFQKSRLYDWQKKGYGLPIMGKFELVENSNHQYLLVPTSIDYAFLFRGQGQFYLRCLPTLYRHANDYISLFIAHLRWVEFELMLKQYPAVNYFQQKGYCIDFVGLAQHYGLETDVLDLTSDIDVAFFFAMCDYDAENDCYHPKTEEREYIGYLYAYPTFQHIGIGDNKEAEDFFTDKLHVIGLQPFSRPGSQKAYSLHMDETGTFFSYLYSFTYTRANSEQAYNYFSEDKSLWRPDFITNQANRLKEAGTKSFTFDALRLCTKRYGGGKSLYFYQRELRKRGFSFSDNQPWKLNKEEYKRIKQEFWETGKKTIDESLVARPLVYEDGEKHPTINVDTFIAELLLRILKSGVESLPGYDSGTAFLEEEGSPAYGLQVSLNRPQTLPNEETGKVDKWDNILKVKMR